MADNVTADPGTGGATFRTDDDGTAHWPYTKLAFGADNTQTIVTSTATNPLPVALSDTDNAVLDNIQTAVELIDDAVYTDATGTPSKGVAVMGTDGTNPQIIAVDTSGNVQVDLVTANVTNAGTFAVQVDGDALTALQLIDNVVATTDAAAGSSPVGVPPLAVRDDALSALTPIEGDFVPLRADANGALWVIPSGTVTVDASGTAVPITDNSGSLTVDNAGTFAVQVDGTALTALQLIDDPVFADDAAFTLASSKVMMVGAIRDDSLSALTAVEGDAVPLRVSSTGALHVTGGGGGTQYNVDDAGGATDTGTLLLAVRDDTLTTLTPIDGDYTQLRVNSQGALHVTGGGGGTEYAVDDALGATPTGGVILATRDDALSTLTPVEGDAVAFRVDANGALWVKHSGNIDVNSHAVTNAGTFAVQVDGDALTALQLIDDAVYTDATGTPSKGIAVMGTDGTNPQLISVDSSGNVQVDLVTANVTNAGTFAVQVDGNALTALQLIDDPVFADDAAFTVGTSKVFAIGAIADETSPDSVDEGDVGIPRMTLDRQLRVTLGSNAAQGTSIFRSIDLDETEEDIKTSAGNLYGYYFSNSNASARFLKFYNATAATVVVGTTTPVLTFYLPATSAGHISFPVPIHFSTAICAAATTGVADNDTGAPGANEVVLNAFYK